jgi:GTP cyclohydrolase I
MSKNSSRQSPGCLGNGGLAVTSAPTEAELDDIEPQQSPGPGSSTMDLARIRRAVREILLAVGEDPDREGLRETPDRVARMYAEVFQGLDQDPRLHLKKLFTQKYDEMVLIRDIRFVSFCEHHLLPVIGKAHVAYLPNGKVIGLSKIPRVLDVLSRRPQMQERLTEELADLLMKELDAKGVAVVIEASHSCMTIRGVNKPDSSFVTSAMRGAFKERLATRSEVMSLIFGSKS